MDRTLPPLSLSKSPLVFVLGQVRFEPILAMDTFVPAIQDALRRKGFIGVIQRNIEFPNLQGTEIVTEKVAQWEFQDAGRSKGFVLDRQGLLFQTTQYSSFEAFIGAFQIGAEIVEQVAHPQTIQRMGLRYVDVVRPAAGVRLEDYVANELRGAQLAQFGKRLGQSHETILLTGPKTRLVARYTEADKGMPLPLDLLPLSLVPRQQMPLKDQFGTLDTDHYTQESGKFTTPAVVEGISALHDVLDQVFRRLVTSKALEEWK